MRRFALIALALGACRHEPKRETTAEDLAVIAQSLDAPLEDRGMAWLPDSAKALGPTLATIEPDGASLVVSPHGGPYYSLARQKTDAGGATTTWSFEVIRRINLPKKDVTFITIPSDRKIPMPVLTDRVLAEYARRIAEHPKGLDNHLYRLAFALRYRDRAAARDQLVDSITRAPKLAQLRMALALFDADGLRDLDAWAHANPSYAHLSDLALVHWILKHADAAIATLREAMKLELADGDGEPLNPTARAMPIADLALAERKFDAAIEVATFMANAKGIDDYSRSVFALDWRSIRAAATYRKGDRAGAEALVNDGLVDPSEPANPLDTRPKLAAAIRAHDDAAVEAWTRPNLGSDLTDFFFPGTELTKKLGLRP